MVEVNVVLHFQHHAAGVADEPVSIFISLDSLVQDIKTKYFDSYLKLTAGHQLGLSWFDLHLLFNLKPMEDKLTLMHYINNYKPG